MPPLVVLPRKDHQIPPLSPYPFPKERGTEGVRDFGIVAHEPFWLSTAHENLFSGEILGLRCFKTRN